MGYLLDQMEKVAYFAEEAMMEKLALTQEQRKAKARAARTANDAGRKANKAVATAMKSGDLAQAASQLGVGVDDVADMTPSNIARTLEKGQGKGALKAVQNAVTGGGAVADVLPHAPGAGYEDLQNMLKSREGIIDSLAGARDEALAKVNQVRAHGLNRARNLAGSLREAQARNMALADDMANFKNLGRFSGAAKWIKGNPRKALASAILGGTGLLGGAGAVGYNLNNGPKPAPKPAMLGAGMNAIA